MERLSRKILARTIGFIMALGVTSTVFAVGASEATRVLVNGQTVTFSQPTQTEQGNLLAPIRPIAELMGARLNTDARSITVIYGDIAVAVAIDNDEMTIFNRGTGVNTTIKMPVPSRVFNGVEYYPIEAIVTELGATVTWDRAANTIYITTPEYISPPPQTTAAVTPPPPPQQTPPQTQTQTQTPRPTQPAPQPTRDYYREAAYRNVMSPSVLSSLIFGEDDLVTNILLSVFTTRFAGTIQGGKFGLNMEIFKVDYSFIPFLSTGIGAGAGVTFRDGVQFNWLGIKPYLGFTAPVWVERDENLRIYGDGFFEIGYSRWGSLVSGRADPGFGLNPGFELGLQYMFGREGGLEASYGITFYSDNRFKHNIGLAARFWPDWL